VLRIGRNLEPAGQPRKITNAAYGWIYGIAWTAGGDELVYGAGGSWSQLLWRVPASGNGPSKRLPFVLPAARSPSIARTPPRLVYAWRQLNVNIWRLDTQTGARKLLIGSSYGSGGPQYSPDGRKIAFHSNQSGNSEIWTCDADGVNCQQLTLVGRTQTGSPWWSPDGRWLAFDSRTEGRSEIYVIASDGGAARRVTEDGANSVLPGWSRDDLWIYFSSDRTGRFEVWKIPKEGGQAAQVTHSGGIFAFESPDGKNIYYSKIVPAPQPMSLYRMPAGGGEETLILTGIAKLNACSLSSKGIYFSPDSKTIQFLDLASGRVSTLAVLEKPVSDGLSVSPDSRYVVWAQVDRDSRDLMLVEGFR
jgi:Tol biopolymer transport system component